MNLLVIIIALFLSLKSTTATYQTIAREKESANQKLNARMTESVCYYVSAVQCVVLALWKV